MILLLFAFSKNSRVIVTGDANRQGVFIREWRLRKLNIVD